MITLFIRCTQAIMKQMCVGDNVNLLKGNAVLAFTYAKIYYRGGGWYAVSGYAHDGKDVHRVVNLVNDMKANENCRNQLINPVVNDYSGWRTIKPLFPLHARQYHSAI